MDASWGQDTPTTPPLKREGRVAAPRANVELTFERVLLDAGWMPHVGVPIRNTYALRS